MSHGGRRDDGRYLDPLVRIPLVGSESVSKLTAYTRHNEERLISLLSPAEIFVSSVCEDVALLRNVTPC